MEMYEQVWKSKNRKYYERVRDSETLETKIRQIYPKFELFEETNEDTPYRFILDENIKLQKRSFDNEKDFRDYKGMCDTVGKNIYGTQSAVYNYIRENYFGNGITLKPRMWHIDIECVPPPGAGFPDPQKAEYPVNCIQIYDNYTDKNIILMYEPLKDKKGFLDRNSDTILKMCTSEKHMFEVFVSLMGAMQPSIITAWNGENFDIPYLTNRAKGIQGFNYRKLSPISVINEKEYQGSIVFEWEGITLVDVMLAYKEFTYTTQTSYGLDHIANIELGIGSGKVAYTGTIAEFFLNDYDRFMDYAVQDVVILKKLEEKLNLVQTLVVLSTQMGINPADAFGTVKPWGMYLTNKARKKNIIMPKDTKHHLDSSIVGGYVAVPQTGVWNWVSSIDVNSEYPLLGIAAHNMSAEKYIDYKDLPADAQKVHDKWMSDEDETKFICSTGMSPNTQEIQDICQKYNMSFGMNAFFKNDSMGILPEIINDIYNERKVAKGKMLVYKALKTKFEEYIEPDTLVGYIKTDLINDIDTAKRTFKNIDEVNPGAWNVEERIELLSQFPNKIAFWDTNQMALKISMNSVYGALSNQYFVLFNRDIAASITGNGRIYIRGLSHYINNKLNVMFNNKKDYVIYNDTDSVYIILEDIVNVIVKQKFTKTFDEMDIDIKEAFLDILLKFIKEYVDKWVDEFTALYAEKFNSFDPSVIGAKLEKIMDKSLFVAKKRYAVRAIYDEGDIKLRNPKIAPTGLDTVRSSTPQLCRVYLKDALGHLMDENEAFIQNFISEAKTAFYKAPIEDISRVSGVSNLDYQFNGDKWQTWKDGKLLTAPIASRASLIHNKILTDRGLEKEFELVTQKDKIKYAYLTLPNTVNANVFGYKDVKVLKKLGIDKYIDYDEMFLKFFIQPMQAMLDVLGFQTERKSTIDEWF